MQRILRMLPILILAAGAAGCANVRPWQRKSLADVTMRPDLEISARAMSEHMWFSREAATGGRGIGGGGCGCN